VTAETLETFLKNGTRSDAGVWSPFSGGRPELLALNMKDIRDQGRRGLLGFQMTAVCVETTLPGKKKAVKSYRPPTAEELRLADVQVEEIDHLFADVPFGVIDEPTPQGGGRVHRGHSRFKLTGL
jgi:hypothetical protein